MEGFLNLKRRLSYHLIEKTCSLNRLPKLLQRFKNYILTNIFEVSFNPSLAFQHFNLLKKYNLFSA
jgi:hypothetical protein